MLIKGGAVGKTTAWQGKQWTKAGIWGLDTKGKGEQPFYGFVVLIYLPASSIRCFKYLVQQ